MANASSRLRIAVLFGGRSPEHDVSVLSANNVMRALSREKYDAVPIFIARDGRWLASSFNDGALTTPSSGTELCLLPGGNGRLLAIPANGACYEPAPVDILFPVLHGLHGEDGSIQGAAQVAGVALAGCGILGSATALDKDVAKRLMAQAGLPTAPSLTIERGGAVPDFGQLEEKLALPFFLKPARQGSSVGVSKVAARGDFEAALDKGFRHDSKLLAERFIHGREIECAVLEDPDGGLFVSRPGEIVPAHMHGFYSYDAKYVDADGAALIVPAELATGLENDIRSMAQKAFRALGCDGMARVDFFVTRQSGIFVNELNTIPGFTDISMYSKAMAASGVAYGEIIDRLVAHGLARAARCA